MTEINNEKPVYCMNCDLWYSDGADQCNIPNPGLRISQYGLEKKKMWNGFENYLKAVYGNGNHENKMAYKLARFIYDKSGGHIVSGTDEYIYAHPSMMNSENNCMFYVEKKKPAVEPTKVAGKGFFKLFRGGK